MKEEIKDYTLLSNTILKDAYNKINNNNFQIVFIVDDNGAAICAISDGDIRRHILSGGTLEDDVLKLSKQLISAKTIHEATILSKQYKVVPMLEQSGVIKLLVTRDGIICKDKLKVPVVIQAGGLGTRLYPYTKILPKPLIPIGDIPIIEKIINRFVEFGCEDFYIIVNHKKEMIKSYFAEINKPYKVTFVDESEPLGTGGGLSLMEGMLDGKFIFANCDTFLDCDFNDIVNTHVDNKNKITMICSNIKVQIPYGTIQCDEQNKLTEMIEKPTFYFLSNVGVYIVDSSVISSIPKQTKVHFTTICEQYAKDKLVGVYEISEHEWHDMGEIDKLNKMIEE